MVGQHFCAFFRQLIRPPCLAIFTLSLDKSGLRTLLRPQRISFAFATHSEMNDSELMQFYSLQKGLKVTSYDLRCKMNKRIPMDWKLNVSLTFTSPSVKNDSKLSQFYSIQNVSYNLFTYLCTYICRTVLCTVNFYGGAVAAWRSEHCIRLRNRRPGFESRHGIRF
jgi:hypothetical protein